MRDKAEISPYLQRPLRSLEEVLRQRRLRPGKAATPAADNCNRPPRRLPPAKSA